MKTTRPNPFTVARVTRAVIAWRFDPATIRQAFDLFAARPRSTPSVRGFILRGLARVDP